MTVNVPWTDTFRTIQVDAAQIDAVYPLNLKSGTNIALAVEHGTESENVTINHTGPGSASQTTTGTKADPKLVVDGGTVQFGADFYVPSFGIDANGHTRELKMTKYTLPTPTEFSLPTASATVKGGIMVGNGLAINGAVLSVKVANEVTDDGNDPVSAKGISAALNTTVSTINADVDGKLKAKVNVADVLILNGGTATAWGEE